VNVKTANILWMRKEGMTLREIAKVYGKSYEWARWMIRPWANTKGMKARLVKKRGIYECPPR